MDEIKEEKNKEKRKTVRKWKKVRNTKEELGDRGKYWKCFRKMYWRYWNIHEIL